jgi:uncharacterized membrane protein
MNGAQQQAKQPVSAMLAGPYGHPYHPILVTIPIGAWVCSLIFDVGSHLSHQEAALRTGALWLIAIGVLGALAAAGVGMLDLLVIPAGTPARRTGLLHAGLNVAVTVTFAANFAWRSGLGGGAGPTPPGQLVLSAVGLLGLIASGYLGGKLAYSYGVRVAAETVQAEGFTATTMTVDRDRTPTPPTPLA